MDGQYEFSFILFLHPADQSLLTHNIEMENILVVIVDKLLEQVSDAFLDFDKRIQRITVSVGG